MCCNKMMEFWVGVANEEYFCGRIERWAGNSKLRSHPASLHSVPLALEKSGQIQVTHRDGRGFFVSNSVAKF